MSTILVTAALEYIELKTIAAILVVVICGILSFQVSARRPLYYNLFVVEMHTWTTRRMVQVLHLGQEFRPHVPWDRLVQRIRARAPRVQGDQRLAISDTNIVIQSPTTVIDSPAPARSPGIDVLTMWDIEMPPPLLGQAPDATRDSQYAAAAAIAILARGDDASLISRIFRNDDRARDESRDGPRHEFVTTDVTYTTPTINRSDLPHQFTRNSDRPPGTVNENFVDHPDQNLGFQDGEHSEDISETDEENAETSDAETSEPTSTEPADRQLPEEERLAKLTREAEYAVIEGPSEGKVLIRLKFLSDIQKDTYASLEDTVSKFKVEHFTDLSNKVVRLIYQGQLLREDNRTLQDYGLQAGSVVHCHISMIPYTRPGLISLPPMVDDSGLRRRTRRFRGPTGEQIAPPDDLARRRAAQDRNVGHVYLLLSTMVPILSGIGLAFFRPDRIRDLLRPATLLTLSQWVCNLFGDTELLPEHAGDEEQDSPSHTFTLFFIFGGQLLAVTIFLYFFPDLFDRIGFSIFCIVLLYFVFVVYYSRQRRRQPADIDAQNDLIETQIVRETISLL